MFEVSNCIVSSTLAALLAPLGAKRAAGIGKQLLVKSLISFSSTTQSAPLSGAASPLKDTSRLGSNPRILGCLSSDARSYRLHYRFPQGNRFLLAACQKGAKAAFLFLLTGPYLLEGTDFS